MAILFDLVTVIGSAAVALGMGASTFAIIFYFMSIRNPQLRETGRPYNKAVFIVLRVAMVLILLTELAKIGFYLGAGVHVAELFAADFLLFVWTLVGVLYANAILMTLRSMPMKLGPALQATSWYALGIITALSFVSMSYLPLLLVYAAAVLIAAVIIELVRQKLTPKTTSAGQ